MGNTHCNPVNMTIIIMVLVLFPTQLVFVTHLGIEDNHYAYVRAGKEIFSAEIPMNKGTCLNVCTCSCGPD